MNSMRNSSSYARISILHTQFKGPVLRAINNCVTISRSLRHPVAYFNLPTNIDVMTFAEVIIFLVLVFLLTKLATPIQKKMENTFFKFFRGRGRRVSDNKLEDTIDVTDSYKNSTNKDKGNHHG